MSKLSFLDPAYAVSIGNQLDLAVGDFLHYFREVKELETLAFYIEGFADFDGLSFSQGVRAAIPKGKEIIFYKAGRTAEGKTAMSGHTASIAGDYMVCESCVGQAGAFVAETFSEFEGLLCLSRSLHGKKIAGNKLAALSNAGYEAVGIADNILGEDYSLQLAEYSGDIYGQIENVLAGAGLSALVQTTNPLDVTPMATEAVYGDIIKILLDLGRKIIVQDILKMTDEEIVDNHSNIRGNQFPLVRPNRLAEFFFSDRIGFQEKLKVFPRASFHTSLFHITPILDRGNRGRIGRRPSNSQFLEFFDQRSFCIPIGRP
jgi:hypothetical protein